LPTATQEVEEAHETPARLFRADFVLGLGVSLQVPLLRVSTRVCPLVPVKSVAEPAAVQDVGELHETALRESSMYGEAVIGLGVTLQLFVSMVSTNGSWKLPWPS
jgi:hypothetical protein